VTEPTASTAPAPPPASTGEPFDPAARYRLDPAVALRPEPFGALAYHYGSRRLTFLRSVRLADLVRQLGDHDSVEAALAAAVPEAERPAYRRALASLADSRFICAC
jgi:mycofactocin biosynthesis protein MftB